MAALTRLCIVDDHTIFRKALKEVILQKEGLQVIFDAENGEELINKLTQNQIDIVLLDLFMPKMSGKEVIEHLKEKYPQIRIIVISACQDLAIIDSVLEMGVHAYLSKTADVTELWEALEQVKSNRLYENKLLKQTLYWQAHQRLTQNDLYRQIKYNATHQKLFELLWQEKSTQEIAHELFMSVSSIEKLKQQLKEKIGAKSTIGLIKYALNKNIIFSSYQSENNSDDLKQIKDRAR
jgi:DNA-binding NarL/FixJ family response regulator